MQDKILDNSLWTIKALWIGDSLSVIEQLALASFVKHGHRVELFTYGDVKNIPPGVVVRNGNEVLDASNIFMYKKKPSYSGFANWFRYVMLFKEGGVWIDTDVVCLKPFTFDTDLFFGREQYNAINCAVVGAKPGLEIFNFLANQVDNPNKFLPYDTFKEKKRKVFRRYCQGNERGNVKWGETGPRGFSKALNHFGLYDRALPTTAFYPIHSSCWTDIFDETYPNVDSYFPDTYAIHLWNEMMRRREGFEKDKTYPENSLIEFLKKEYLS